MIFLMVALTGEEGFTNSLSKANGR